MLKSVSPLGRRTQMDQVTVGAGMNPTLGNRFKKRWCFDRSLALSVGQARPSLIMIQCSYGFLWMCVVIRLVWVASIRGMDLLRWRSAIRHFDSFSPFCYRLK